MSRDGRTFVALAGAVIVIVIATWFDNTFMSEAVRNAQRRFDLSELGVVIAGGSMLVAASALIVALLAWRARSIVLGLTYAVLGGFLVLLPWLVWNFAAEINGVPPVLPEPLLTVISQIYLRTGSGSLNAAGTIGGAMLIVGVVAMLRPGRDRGVAKSSVEVTDQATGPTRS